MLVRDEATPKDRSESEISGYRDVLELIHSSAEHMRVGNDINQANAS